LIHELEESFVDKGSRLKRAPAPFAAHLSASDAPEFLVNQ
jgi:hypothetical protein